MKSRSLTWCLLAALACPAMLTRADAAAPAAAPSADQSSYDMADAAKAFWQSLTPDQQKTAGYKFDDAERFDWHFIPKPRKGLTIKDMTSAQRALAHALLASGMSQKGYVKAVTIMSLDQVLKDMEQGKGPTRDPELYYFTIFGQPGDHQTWGWRVEGHHVSLNFTIVNGKGVAATPAFLGANPAEVREGPRKGLRILGEEEDMGRKLIKSLNDDQRKTAVFEKEAPKDIVTSNARKAMIKDPVGIPYSQLNDEQKHLLVELVGDYADRHRPDIAANDLKRINAAGWDKVLFAWAGGLEPGEKHYYRVQGPTFLIEFDNTQNNANHIHSVWRDMTGDDFGEDLLLEHYQQNKHD
jgi:hypothetical protein